MTGYFHFFIAYILDIFLYQNLHVSKVITILQWKNKIELKITIA